MSASILTPVDLKRLKLVKGLCVNKAEPLNNLPFDVHLFEKTVFFKSTLSVFVANQKEMANCFTCYF